MAEIKSSLFGHQQIALERMEGKVAFALFPEPGTGKSRIILEDSLALYRGSKINLLVVIAPAGVDRKWRDECERWLPDSVESPWSWHLYRNSAAKIAEARRAEFVDDVKRGDCFCIVAFSVDSIITAQGYTFIKKLLEAGPAVLAIDESTKIKNPKALRTKAALRLGQMAKYRRILTGTPLTQSVADLYSQFQFLDEGILGIKSYFAYRKRYQNMAIGYGPGGRTFTTFMGIRNEEGLLAKIKPYSYRVSKADCLDLPRKIYTSHYVELSKKQRLVYNQLKNDFITELSRETIITAEMALTRFGKLQQVVSNFVTDNLGVTHTVDEEQCPREAALVDLIQLHAPGTKFVIWAKFKREIKNIVAYLRTNFPHDNIVEYHGDVADDMRHENVVRFQTDPDCLFFVANAMTAGLGLDLFAAHNVIYYSNTFSLEARLQSEDRCHRPGQVNCVTYYDFEAVDTIDSKILAAIHAKKSLAETITGKLGRTSSNIF